MFYLIQTERLRLLQKLTASKLPFHSAYDIIKNITMKKLLLSALMLTGVAAMAQEPAKQTDQSQQQPVQTAQPAQPAPDQVKPEPVQPAAQAQPAKTRTKKTEATVKEEKTEVKKADPAKKSK